MSQILIIEVKEDFGLGGSVNPLMQLVAYYAKIIAANDQSPAVMQTTFPALGLEVLGHSFR